MQVASKDSIEIDLVCVGHMCFKASITLNGIMGLQHTIINSRIMLGG